MFDLTPQERKAILFLLCVCLLGAGIDFFLKARQKTGVFACIYMDMGKLDLNTAGKESLMSVAGIGEKLASRIIEYRDQGGVFNDLEELKSIKGITNYRYEKIKDFLIVRDK